MSQFLMASPTVDPNGAVRVKKIPRQKSKVRKQSKNVVAIDFGTKNCSLAYLIEGDQIARGIPKLPLNGSQLRVPTAILFSSDGKVYSFGNDAKRFYLDLEDAERERFTYFEEIKMNLHNDPKVSRKLKVKALNGREFYLVDVISHILRHLKEEFLELLRRSGHTSVSVADLEWVITVPAIWRARGKQLMREAGYQAGLCSDQPFNPLTPADSSCHFPIEDSNPDRLALALESESAALYCHEKLKLGQVAPFCENPSGPLQPHSYLMLDIGGGTVDISAHKVVEFKNGVPVVEETIPSTGNDCGGTMVNREFRTFLETLFNDVGFSRYVNTSDTLANVRNACELNNLINTTFEEQKQMFGRQPVEKHREAVLRLHTSFLDTYQSDIEESIRKNFSSTVKLRGQNVRISVSMMETLFRPVIEGIVSIVKSTLHALKGVDVIYLVGGFGGCQYLYQHLFAEFSISYKCLVPPDPEYAVVEGAVMFRANPAIVQSRRVRETYGKSVMRPFNQKIHNRKHLVYDDTGLALCGNLFQTIVEVGEAVSPSHVYTCSSVPCSLWQKNMFVEIFRSTCSSKDIWYVTGDNCNVEKVGEVVISLEEEEEEKEGETKPKLKSLTSLSKRKVDFTFDFSQTEIQVLAFGQSSKKTVKVVLDFLS